MLASKYLLKGEANIERVKKEGTLIQSSNFGIAVLDTKEQNDPSFAFIVSTKISKLAVHRNRVKRAISESVRTNMSFVPKGVRMIFLAKKSIASKTTDEIMKETEKFLREVRF